MGKGPMLVRYFAFYYTACQILTFVLQTFVARGAVERAVYRLAATQNRAGLPGALREWETHFRHVTDTAFDREDEGAANLCNEMGY